MWQKRSGFLKKIHRPLTESEINFAKENRRNKPWQYQNIIPSKLKRRHCVPKVAEIFGLTGKITPITATLKMDLHN